MGIGFKSGTGRCLIAILILCLALSRASALVFNVSNTNDGTSLKNLRGAVIVANRIGGKNIIILGPAPQSRGRSQPQSMVFHLTISGTDEDKAKTGDLDILRGQLTIIGAASNVVIDATGLGDRAFQVFKNAKLTLQDVTITGGVGNGGGIENDGICFLANCIIAGNRTADGSGPYNESGFGGNGGNGGGVYNSGFMVLSNCSVNSNLSGQGGNGGDPYGTLMIPIVGGDGGQGGNGAGLYNEGEMQLYSSTVNNNACGAGGNGDSSRKGGNAGVGGSGAGIYNNGVLSLNTSTISQNLCGNGGTGGNGTFGADMGLPPANGGLGGDGGGIYNSGSLDLTSCTIVLNQTGMGGTGGNSISYDGSTTNAASGGPGGAGGGILTAGNVTVVIRNTLVAQNLTNLGGTGGINTEYYHQTEQVGDSGTDGIGFDVAGDFVSQGFNLIGTADGSTGFTNGVNADQVGSIANPIDPLLGSLQMNGGPTPTHALLPQSPAIDQGNSFGIHTDQRGDLRPYNNTLIPNVAGGDGCDIGAFELEVGLGFFPPN